MNSIASPNIKTTKGKEVISALPHCMYKDLL
jgi:hypothetical protein